MPSSAEPIKRSQLLTFEEIERLARISTIPDVDLTLPTNGSLLAGKARALREAGLRWITVSLDSLDDAVFRRMNDVDFPVAMVLAGIEAADVAGLRPVKVNMVVRRGLNADSVIPLATFGWRLDDVLPAREIIRANDAVFPIDANYHGEVAERWRYKDGQGEIGVIASVTQAFCSLRDERDGPAGAHARRIEMSNLGG